MTAAVINAAPSTTNTNDKPKKLDSGTTKSSNSDKNPRIVNVDDIDHHKEGDYRYPHY